MSYRLTIPSSDSPWLIPLPPMAAPQHGGDLLRAKRRYPLVDHWLDLSAALNPQPYPVPDIPPSCFQQLPDGYEPLLTAAASYYRQQNLWPINGSQQGIELLPGLYGGTGDNRAEKRVAVPYEGYQEHAWCWQKNGFSVYRYRADSPEALIGIAEQCDVLVVINPNNPTGQLFDRNTLLACHHVLQAKSGWLVVDEAFIDAFTTDEQQELSVSDAACDSLIVLRSVGKFFGLAGIRSGFVLAGESVIEALKMMTGPWPLSGVTAWLTEQMLQDLEWQRAARKKLDQQSGALRTLLNQVFPGFREISDRQPTDRHLNEETLFREDFLCADQGQTPLFVSLVLTGGETAAKKLQEWLAVEGIWIRVFPHTGRIRLGLPGGGEQLIRLKVALTGYVATMGHPAR